MTVGRKRNSDRVDRVERARKLVDAGLTQAEIAETLQMSLDQVQRVLKGYKPVRNAANVTPAPYYRGYNWRAGWM